MIGKVLRHWAYTQITNFAEAVTGVQPYWRTKYDLYLVSGRWQLIRGIRMWQDGQKCTRCGKSGHRGNRLQIHHLPGTKRMDKGVAGFFRELTGCTTLCDKCHRD